MGVFTFLGRLTKHFLDLDVRLLHALRFQIQKHCGYLYISDEVFFGFGFFLL